MLFGPCILLTNNVIFVFTIRRSMRMETIEDIFQTKSNWTEIFKVIIIP